jgi:urease accessory protein
MKHAIVIDRAGSWPIEEAIGSVSLNYDMRQRRRIKLNCGEVGPVLLDLERPSSIRPGDGLRLAEGGWLGVTATAEDLIEIRVADTKLLPRLAWHLGNRHCPAEIDGERIYIRHDHVLEKMLTGLGAEVRAISRPFYPEGGAYDEQGHGHD